MPNRIIKESICTSENIDQLTGGAEIAFYRLMVNCDDYGRMDARPKILKSRLFPLKEMTDQDIADYLDELVRADLITVYEVDGKPYLQMKTWDKHQQVRAKKSKYPSPSEITCNQMQSDADKCPRNPIQSESESNPNDEKPQKRFIPPTLEDVTAYMKEIGCDIDPQYFLDYQEARNWILSNGKKAKDWKAVIRTWAHNNISRQKPQALKTVSAQAYGQRDYSKEQAEAMARMLKGAG